MDLSLLMFREGVRAFSRRRTDAAGVEHTFYFLAQSPTTLTKFGAEAQRFKDDDGTAALGRLRHIASFVAQCLCDEDGKTVMSVDQAMKIPQPILLEMLTEIREGSAETAEAVKND